METEKPIIDKQRVEELQMVGEDAENLFIMLAKMFVEEIQIRYEKIQEAVLAKNAKKITECAHTSKGSASNLGFARLASVLEKLEHMGRNEEIDGAEELLPIVFNELQNVKTTFEKEYLLQSH